MLEDFVFLRPWALWFLPLAALIYWLLLSRQQSNDHNLSAWIDPELLPHLSLSSDSGRNARWLGGALATLWLLACLALAAPSWSSKEVPLQRNEQPLLVLLDLSWSMNATDLQPDRITRARFKIEDLLLSRKEGLTGLIVYSGSAHLAVPLSSDRETILNLLPDLRPGIMPVNGSNLDQALELALGTLVNAGYAEDGHLLIFTDGVADDIAQASAEIMQNSPTRVNIIALGEEGGEPIPIRSGDSFVRDSQGQLVLTSSDWSGLEYLRDNTSASLQAMRLDSLDIDSVLTALGSSNEDLARQLAIREDQSYWLVALVLPLWLLAWVFGRNALLSFGALLLLWSPNASADAFRNQDQQALQLLRAEQYGEAAELFQSPDWRGYARIQQGEYATALEELQELQDPNSVYNRANARLKSLQVTEAISDYQQLLEQSELPEAIRADAEHNLAIAEQILELMQQNQDGQQSEDGQQDQQSDSEQGEQQQSGQQQGEQSQSQQGESSSSQSESAEGEQSQQANSQQTANEQQQSGADSEEFNAEQAEADASSSSEAEPEESSAEAEESLREQQQRLAQQLLEQSAESEGDPETGEAAELSPEQLQRIQAQQRLQRQLQSIPDDPGGLLRRKFERQARQMPRPSYDSLEDQL